MALGAEGRTTRQKPGQNADGLRESFRWPFLDSGIGGRNQSEQRQNPSRTVAEPSKLSNTTTENSEEAPALGRNHGGTTINAHRTTKSQKGAGQNRGRTTSEPKEMCGALGDTTGAVRIKSDGSAKDILPFLGRDVCL